MSLWSIITLPLKYIYFTVGAPQSLCILVKLSDHQSLLLLGYYFLGLMCLMFKNWTHSRYVFPAGWNWLLDVVKDVWHKISCEIYAPSLNSWAGIMTHTLALVTVLCHWLYKKTNWSRYLLYLSVWFGGVSLHSKLT